MLTNTLENLAGLRTEMLKNKKFDLSFKKWFMRTSNSKLHRDNTIAITFKKNNMYIFVISVRDHKSEIYWWHSGWFMSLSYVSATQIPVNNFPSGQTHRVTEGDEKSYNSKSASSWSEKP